MERVKRKSFVMYTEYLEQTAILSDEECGKLFRAILVYAGTGAESDLTGLSALAFGFIRGDLDRNFDKYDELSARRREAGRAGGRKRVENLAKSECGNPVEKSVESVDDAQVSPEDQSSKTSKCLENGKQNKQMLEKSQANASYNDNDNVNVNDNVNDNDNVNVNVNVNDNVTPLSPAVFKTDGQDGGAAEAYKETVLNHPEEGTGGLYPSLEDVRSYCRSRNSPVDPDRFWKYHNDRNWMLGGKAVGDWRALLRKWEERETQKSPSDAGSITSALREKYGGKPSEPERSYDLDEFVALAMNHKFDE